MENEGDDCPIGYSAFLCDLARTSPDYRAAFLDLSRKPHAVAEDRPVSMPRSEKPHYSNLDVAIRAARDCPGCQEKRKRR